MNFDVTGQDLITMGQGEYIVFHEGKERKLSQKTHEKVYQVLNGYLPSNMIKNGFGENEYMNRHSLIQHEIEKIDPTLKIAFIPKTLYELIYIRKAISEDMLNECLCPMHTLDQGEMTNEDLKNIGYMPKSRKCWHASSSGRSYQEKRIEEIAFHLNNVAIKTLSPSSNGFTLDELISFTEKEIEYLKNHRKQYEAKLDEIEKKHGGLPLYFNGIDLHSIFSNAIPGLTTNFGWDYARCQIKPMGIRDEHDAQIIKNSVVLDCSKVALRCFLLYRGTKSDLEMENIDWHNLSYGSSLFAGAVYDGGATAFHFMRDANGYVLPVPFEELDNPLFHIPTTNTIAQLLSQGELFHIRTKVPKDWCRKICDYEGNKNIRIEEEKLQHLKSSLNSNELNEAFERFKKKAIMITKNPKRSL